MQCIEHTSVINACTIINKCNKFYIVLHYFFKLFINIYVEQENRIDNTYEQ